LLDELARELEAGEERPLTPLVRKAARLAASLGESEYRTLFQLHLDGIGSRDQARATPLSADIDPVRTRRTLQALLDDRATGDQVSAHSLPQIEEILAMFRSVENRNITPSETNLRQVLHRIRNRLGLFITQADATLAAGQTAVAEPHSVATRMVIFIGHGRSNAWHDLRDYLRDHLHLEWTEFSRDPPAGMTVTERLEQMLNASCFAFIVMTGEDLHPDGALHARENVVHELGLCQGRLGRRRAIVLLEEGCTEFSNITGLVQVRFPAGRLMDASVELRRILEREEIVKPDAG